ncbi:MAG: hypothetical protein IPK11_16260 [Ignavibacteria bacterium]|nr:hypothetical protein [Ignavibacteria bacterium]
MKTFFLFVLPYSVALFLCTSTNLYSQSMEIQTIWEHRLDTNTFKSMIMTDDGGIVASITMPGGDLDYVLKLNSEGKKEWSFVPFNNKSFFIKSLQKPIREKSQCRL